MLLRFFISLLSITLCYSQQVLYFDNSNTNPSPDGTSDNPFTQISEANSYFESTYVSLGGLALAPGSYSMSGYSALNLLYSFTIYCWNATSPGAACETQPQLYLFGVEFLMEQSSSTTFTISNVAITQGSGGNTFLVTGPASIILEDSNFYYNYQETYFMNIDIQGSSTFTFMAYNSEFDLTSQAQTPEYFMIFTLSNSGQSIVSFLNVNISVESALASLFSFGGNSLGTSDVYFENISLIGSISSSEYSVLIASTYLGLLQMTNFNISIQGTQIYLFEIVDTIAVNMDNVIFFDSVCSDCLILLNEGDTFLPTVTLQNFTFQNASFSQGFNFTNNLETVTFQNFSIINSSLPGALFAFNYIQSNQASIQSIDFISFYISGSQIQNLILYVPYPVNEILFNFIISHLTIDNCQIQNPSSTEPSALFDISYSQVNLIDSFINQSFFNNYSLFSSSSFLNVIMQNVLIANSQFSNSSLIHYKKFIFIPNIFQVLAISNCMFSNITVQSDLDFIKSHNFFNLIMNSSFDNFTGSTPTFIEVTYPQGDQLFWNATLFGELFGNILFLDQILYQIGYNNADCLQNPCPFVFFQGNVFSQISIFEDDNFHALLSMSGTGTELLYMYFNIYQNLIGKFDCFKVNNTYMVSSQDEILYNVQGSNYLDYGYGSIIQFYQNLVSFSTLNLVSFNENFDDNSTTIVDIADNVINGIISPSLMTLFLKNISYLEFTNNTISNILLMTGTYEKIRGFDFKIDDSPKIAILLANNTFTNISMMNNITLEDYKPTLDNRLLEIKIDPDSFVDFLNNKFKNIYLSAIISTFIKIDSSVILIKNLSLENILIRNSGLEPINLKAPSLGIENLRVKNCCIANPEIISSNPGLIVNDYLSQYAPNYNYKVTINGLFAEDNDLEGSLLSLSSDRMTLEFSNFEIKYGNSIISLGANSGNFTFKNVNYESIRGVFLTLKGGGTIDSQISLVNFTQKNEAQSPMSPTLDINWKVFNFSGYQVNLEKVSLFDIDGFTGQIYMELLNITGKSEVPIVQVRTRGPSEIEINYLMVYNAHINGILSVEANSYCSVSVNYAILSNSSIDFAFQTFNNNQTYIGFSSESLVTNNLEGQTIFNLTNSYLTLSNIIISGRSPALLQGENINPYISNFIQTNSITFQTMILIQSKYPLSFSLTNITLNSVNSSDSWLVTNSSSVSSTSLVMASSDAIFQISSTNMTVNESIFYSNMNFNGLGGVLVAENSLIDVNNTIILENVALAGGFAYAELSDGEALNCQICNTTQNYGILYGDIIASEPWTINLTMSLVPNVDPLFTNYYAAELVNGNLGKQSSEFQIFNASYAFALNTLLEISLVDFYNQRILFNPNVPISISISNNSSSILLDNLVTQPSNSIQFLASNITLPSILSTGNATITVQYLQASLIINLSLQTRNCMPGENFNQATQQCIPCSPGTYSILVNQSCLPCPNNAECPGGNFIIIQENYWIDPLSSVVYPCVQDGVLRCLGGSNPSTQCSEGYSGALCNGCNFAAGYAPSAGNICNSCSTDILWLLVENLFYILLTIGYQLWIIYFNYLANKRFVNELIGDHETKNKEALDDRHISTFIYILNYFLQLVFITISFQTFNLEWLNSVYLGVASVLSIFTSQTQQNSRFDCLLLAMGVDPTNLTFTKIGFGIFFPFVKIIIISIIFIIINYKKKVRNLSKKVWQLSLNILLLDQLGILESLSKLTSCAYDSVMDYSDIDPSLSCSSADFLTFVETFGLGGFIFWAVAIPVVYFIILYFFSERRVEREFKRILGPLLNNYVDKRYYWGLISMMLRLSILASFTFIGDQRNSSLLAALLGILYISLTINNSPFREDEINRAEEISITVIVVSLVFFNQGIGNSAEGVTIAYGVVIILGYLATFFYLLWCVFFRTRKRILRKNKEKLFKQFLLEDKLNDSSFDDKIRTVSLEL